MGRHDGPQPTARPDRPGRLFLALGPAVLAAGLLVLPPAEVGSRPGAEPPVKAVLVIHGGAGVLAKDELAKRRQEYKEDLTRSLRAGHEVWNRGGTGVDVVEAAIKVLEDSPLFNAGRGAVFDADGNIGLDASIMEGKTKKAGAVAGVRRVRNPISAARAVMEKSKHVLLIGEGADRFALAQGLPRANLLHFWTEHRWRQLKEAQEEEERAAKKPRGARGRSAKELGTVGAVALDQDGHLAAGTSTGGLTNRLPGRVGDSPIIGAGTYADDDACAVSATGHGEFFIRHAVAHDIVARMKYGKASLAEAASAVIHGVLRAPHAGEGGVIALDRKGNAVMPYNSPGMYRGYVTRGGKAHVFFYEKEE